MNIRLFAAITLPEDINDELELMEKRGRATKTKAETNAKYGW